MDEFRFLLTGGLSAGDIPPNPLPWLADKLWAEMNRLSHFLAFSGLAEQVQQDQVRVMLAPYMTTSHLAFLCRLSSFLITLLKKLAMDNTIVIMCFSSSPLHHMF